MQEEFIDLPESTAMPIDYSELITDVVQYSQGIHDAVWSVGFMLAGILIGGLAAKGMVDVWK